MEDKEGPSSQPRPRKGRHKDEQFPAGPPHERATTQGSAWLVRANENITMAPR